MSMRKHKRKLIQRMARRRFGRWSDAELSVFGCEIETLDEMQQLVRMTMTGARMNVGDVITVTGLPDVFRVTSVGSDRLGANRGV